MTTTNDATDDVHDKHGTERTVTLRLWEGRRSDYRSPDRTVELPLNQKDVHRHSAETITLCDDIAQSGWMGFDVVDLPDDVEMVQLNVHSDDSYHGPQPLDETPVERGLVYDGGPYNPGVDPFVCKLHGIVEVYAEVYS